MSEFGFNAYYRKGFTYLNGIRIYSLQRANTSAKGKRAQNIEFKEDHTRTGNYSKLCKLTEELAKEFGFDAVVVCGVLNEFLPSALIRYGYQEIQNTPPDFIKLI